MFIFRTRKELKNYLSQERKRSKTIGLVPTMGALHEGHLSLIKRAKQETDITVCSIYVNPTQFNEQSDLEQYPKNESEDIRLLEQEQCTAVFIPTTTEVYEKGNMDLLSIDLEGVDKVLEGISRPGHFDGMVTVVHKLFKIVEPDRAYFGEKDYQQLLIVKKMAKKMGFKTEIVGCPIVREEDGLAMSSRNKRLNKEEREIAPLIGKVLKEVKEQVSQLTIDALKDKVTLEFEKDPRFKLDYFEIFSDNGNVMTLSEEGNKERSRAFIAVSLRNIRLIDNISLKS